MNQQNDPAPGLMLMQLKNKLTDSAVESVEKLISWFYDNIDKITLGKASEIVQVN